MNWYARLVRAFPALGLGLVRFDRQGRVLVPDVIAAVLAGGRRVATVPVRCACCGADVPAVTGDPPVMLRHDANGSPCSGRPMAG